MSKSWSYIKKRLEQDLLCSELHGRVKYQKVKYRKSHDNIARISVLVDNRELLSGDDITFQKKVNNLYKSEKSKQDVPKRQWNGKEIVNDEINSKLEDSVDLNCVNKGYFDEYYFDNALNYYLNNPIEKCLNSTNNLVLLFAILDRRVGKRTLIKIKDNINSKEDFLKKIYKLRTDLCIE